VALAGLGIILGLVGLEIILRVAAPLLRPSARGFSAPITAATSGTVRVLCVGDSHTYGLWVKPEESYPSRLRSKLAHRQTRFEVLNAGVPGMNSSQVREAMPRLLNDFAPDIVLLMVGVADCWNLAALDAEDFHGWRWYLRGGSLWDRSRVVKLARLIRFNLGNHRRSPSAHVTVVPQSASNPDNWRIEGGEEEIAVANDAHFGDPVSDARLLRRVLWRDLAVISSAVQARGAHLILMTYATDGLIYNGANAVTRAFAQETSVPLIDLAAQLQHWSKPPGNRIAFFPDLHPRAPGYELIARAVAAGLLGASPEPQTGSNPGAR